ncbi:MULTISPECIES: hypothetical protein [unclassified Actinomadura]|jgi:hypothetical protein|uniref:hypothetical protein n=1 Tax=unclassified Actinomadura TaxID=2626254 RepID=UPI0014048526|nr:MULTISPECIES: hypothetical protein [unclassified Actinomadura]
MKVTMEGILGLVVVSLLAAFCVRWAAVRLRLPMPTRVAVITVFVLVVLAMYGQHLNG